MSNMNLATGQLNGPGKRNGMSIGVIIGFIILLIAAGVSVFLVMKEKRLTQEVVAAEETYNVTYADLMTGRMMDVVDLQSRIFKLKEIIDQRNDTLDALVSVEKNLVAGVVIKDFEYSAVDKKIKLDGVAINLDNVARQSASFKSYEYFSDVSLENIRTDAENGTIEFSVSIIGK